MANFLDRIIRPRATRDARPETRSAAGGAITAAVGAADFGVPVNNDSALRVTALYAGLRLISENVASLPKTLLVEDAARGQRPDRRHPVYRLIAEQPNSYMNAFTFWSAISTWVKGWGNAYAIIKRQGGTPVALYPVHPAGVRITTESGPRGLRKWYQVSSTDPNLTFLNGTYSDDDMLHFMELTLDGIKGINPIIYNAATIGKSLAMEKFAAEFFAKGGNIRAVLESEGHLGDEEYKKFVEHFQMAAQNYGTPLLEYGIKYKQLSVDPVAEALVSSEVLSVQDIARLLNVPPHMIAELSHATFSNIEHQTIQFVQYSLRPVVKRFEVELESKLFSDSERGRYDVKFILEGLLRGDTQARSAYYHNAILDGYMNRNEVRELEGLEKVDGLDAFLLPLNMTKEEK